MYSTNCSAFLVSCVAAVAMLLLTFGVTEGQDMVQHAGTSTVHLLTSGTQAFSVVGTTLGPITRGGARRTRELAKCDLEDHFNVTYDTASALDQGVPHATIDAAVTAANEAFCIWADILAPFEYSILAHIAFNTTAYFGSDRVLAEAGNNFYTLDPQPNTFFSGSQLRQGVNSVGFNHSAFPDPDFSITFNTDFDFFYGLNGADIAPDQYDFISILCHEIGHGLGFVDIFNSTSDNDVNWPSGHDDPSTPFTAAFQVDHAFDGQPHEDLTEANFKSGDELTAALTGQYGHLVMRNAEAEDYIVVYSPNPYQAGSSCSHFNEDTYLPGNFDSLMTPFFASGEVVRCIGPLTRGALQDVLGYALEGSFSTSCIRVSPGELDSPAELDWPVADLFLAPSSAPTQSPTSTPTSSSASGPSGTAHASSWGPRSP